MVQLVAVLRGVGSRHGAVQERHQPRADGRREGPQDVQVARQLGGRRRCGRADGRRRAAAGVRVARLHLRHHARRRRSYNAVSESYRKIRNTCRFVLGNLADFDPGARRDRIKDMLEFDRFILARTEKLKSEVRRAYEAFEFQTAFQVMQNFIVVDLSSLYIDVARDRLYCACGKLARAALGPDGAVQNPRRAGAGCSRR